jgi:hypothetical protein
MGAVSTRSSGADKVRFNRDVRPILSDACFHCHGPDEKERKGGLRLDVRTEALKPAKSGASALVPGKPEQSEMINRISSKDADEVMPPNKLHKDLTAAQKETLRNWVLQGAEYEGHWAFIASAPQTMDAVRNVVNHAIDFLVAKTGWTPELAYTLCSVALDLRLSQVVNQPQVTVTGTLAKNLFPKA